LYHSYEKDVQRTDNFLSAIKAVPPLAGSDNHYYNYILYIKYSVPYLFDFYPKITLGHGWYFSLDARPEIQILNGL
jgi:hypothetical protein